MVPFQTVVYEWGPMVGGLRTRTTSSVTPPPTTPADPSQPTPVTDDEVVEVVRTGRGLLAGTVDVVGEMIDNLGNSGYQTGLALMAATAAVIAMIDIGTHKAVVVPVVIGAFWAGWLGWNTVSGQSNPLFPDPIGATEIWDVARAGDTGFLIVASVASAAAFFLWRRGVGLATRVWLVLGAVLGASFVHNLVDAVRLS